eukprot:9799809-Alexandrium_andersonii.AAC.1
MEGLRRAQVKCSRNSGVPCRPRERQGAWTCITTGGRKPCSSASLESKSRPLACPTRVHLSM